MLLTLVFFVGSLGLHWTFGWLDYKSERIEQHLPLEVQEYLIQMVRDTMENWQSEFIQLLWQIGGLATLLWVGSPSSKEGDERKEAKLDFIIQKLDPDNYTKLQHEWEKIYPKE